MRKAQRIVYEPVETIGIKLGIGTMPISMKADSALQMLMTYYPKTLQSLLEKAMNKAQSEQSLSLDKKYAATFTPCQRNSLLSPHHA